MLQRWQTNIRFQDFDFAILLILCKQTNYATHECDHDVVILLISLHNTQFIVIKFDLNLTNYRLQDPENKKDIIKNQTFSDALVYLLS